MPNAFEVQTDTLPGPICKVSVVGELDLDPAPQLGAELRTARAHSKVSLLIDLSNCEFIDSSGLALIIQTWRDLENEDGAALAMCCASDQVERLLRITGAYEAIAIYDSIDDAVAALH
jgi:anti-anti-sigma factor